MEWQGVVVLQLYMRKVLNFSLMGGCSSILRGQWSKSEDRQCLKAVRGCGQLGIFVPFGIATEGYCQLPQIF